MVLYSHRGQKTKQQEEMKMKERYDASPVSTVNGYEIYVDACGVYMIWLNPDIDFDGNKLNVKTWKTLKGAMKWAGKN